MPLLAFDIETIPDIAGIRILNGLPATLDDEEVAQFAFQQRRTRTGTDFLPLHLQRVVTIACVLELGGQFRVFSLSEPECSEKEIIRRFFDGVGKYAPQLVSWNGGGFDLPVLHYRGLIQGVEAARYWDQGEGDFLDSREYKWNNYISRYHQRHLDLMDLLALYQSRASVPLDELAKLMGFPGKLGMDGSAVWPQWQAGRIDEIRDYCETDAMNTFLVFLRFQKMRGVLTDAEYSDCMQRIRATLTGYAAPHWQAFLAAWNAE